MSFEEKKNYQQSTQEVNSVPIILSIVIPTFNSSSLLLRCLEALKNQSVPKSEFEIIVANDGSTDETIQILSQFQVKSNLNLKWTSIPNSGPGNARNAGVKISRGLWIGFLDADVIPDINWIENAIKLIHQKPYAGAFEGRTEVSQRKMATPFTHQTENLDGGRYPTCNFLVRRSLANFYPAYKIPFREDSDLAFSILESGFKIIFAPELTVEHPPLSSKYSRPISLALRYYYDGLLARRFPSRYKLELDAHRIVGLKISHLKRKLYAFFVLSQIFLFYTIINEFYDYRMVLSSGIYFVGLFISSISSLRYSILTNLTLKDWLVFFLQLNIIPWIMGYSLIRGWIDFREEQKFSIE